MTAAAGTSGCRRGVACGSVSVFAGIGSLYGLANDVVSRGVRAASAALLEAPGAVSFERFGDGPLQDIRDPGRSIRVLAA